MTELLPWLLGILSTVAGGYILHRIKSQDEKSKKQDEKIDNLETSITQLKATSVSEAHVRNLMKEELKPLSDTLDRLNSNVSEIKDWVAEERGFKKGLNAASKNNN